MGGLEYFGMRACVHTCMHAQAIGVPSCTSCTDAAARKACQQAAARRRTHLPLHLLLLLLLPLLHVARQAALLVPAAPPAAVIPAAQHALRIQLVDGACAPVGQDVPVWQSGSQAVRQ